MKAKLSVAACSSMILTSNSNKTYWFRTCDIDTDIWKEGAHIVSIPKGAEIAFTGREKEKSQYGFLGMTNDKNDTWLLDGINTEGLVGGLLLLLEGTSVQKPRDGYEGYVGMELVTKFLSSCASVKEVMTQAKKVQVCNIPYEEQSVLATMHYHFTDKTGDEVILEASDKENPGIFTIYSKQDCIGIMTNSPSYTEQISNLSWYIAASPEFRYGREGRAIEQLDFESRQVSGNKEAAHLLRNDTFPASYCSYERFVRLAVLKALNHNGREFEDDKMLALGSSIMGAVYEPDSEGIYHYRGFDEKKHPIGQKHSKTQYLVMYDTAQGRMYLKAFDESSFTGYQLYRCSQEALERYWVKHKGMAGILWGN